MLMKLLQNFCIANIVYKYADRMVALRERSSVFVQSSFKIGELNPRRCLLVCSIK